MVVDTPAIQGKADKVGLLLVYELLDGEPTLVINLTKILDIEMHSKRTLITFDSRLR